MTVLDDFPLTLVRISIHIPRAGDDVCHIIMEASCVIFQSTSPVRGMTVGKDDGLLILVFQSTSPVRGMTHDEGD